MRFALYPAPAGPVLLYFPLDFAECFQTRDVNDEVRNLARGCRFYDYIDCFCLLADQIVARTVPRQFRQLNNWVNEIL